MLHSTSDSENTNCKLSETPLPIYQVAFTKTTPGHTATGALGPCVFKGQHGGATLEEFGGFL